MTRKTAAVFVLFFISLATACGEKKLSPDEMIAAAKMVNKRTEDAYNKKDLDAFMENSWKSPQLTVIDLGHHIIGWTAWKQKIENQFKEMPTAKFTLTETNYVAFADSVLGWGSWEFSLPTPSGVERSKGLYSNVRAIRDGKWVTVLEHYSGKAEKKDPAEIAAEGDVIDKKINDAFNQKNVNLLMQNYWNNPDLLVLDLGQMYGWSDWKRSMAEYMKKEPRARFEFLQTQNKISGEFLLGYGRYKITIPAKKGRSKVLEGLRSNVKARKDGNWVIVTETWARTPPELKPHSFARDTGLLPRR